MASSYSPDLPRAVLLALWLEQARHETDFDAAQLVWALEQDDEPHRVTGAVPPVAPDLFGSTMALLRDQIPLWIARGRAVALVPVPGDAAGVPPRVSSRALVAEECTLLMVDDVALALVPEVEAFGSQWEQGFHVTWHASEVDPWETRFLGAVGTLSEAERELRAAMRTATDALVGLDVSRWRPEAADAIGELGSGLAPSWNLPPDLDQRQVQVLSLAARLRGIVELARQDDGGAVNLWQADQRLAALHQVDHSARRALAAATFWSA